ncbi:MAG: glycosyl transferase group 1 [Bryobacterales bacterium]|nr:glycosyl transferase group 1 [Bryobacterales bacterium]
MRETPPRVAFFTDCFHEVNGVALTSRQLDGFARRRDLPFFSLHIGPETKVVTEGPVTTMELKRSALSISLDAGMYFDLLGLRHLEHARRALTAFAPDLIHITGPGDCGLLGAMLAWQMNIPLVASWHTDLHKFGARRLEKWNRSLAAASEPRILETLTWFYGFARVLLAPNPELIEMLEKRTCKPAFLMQRGVDTDLYSPSKRDRTDGVFTIGYVGRLSPEKNVRMLAKLQRPDVRFLIVGQGSEGEWLRNNLANAEFTGVLRGELLARAYANMDVFAFPSDTDTFGNVVLEALASGLPTIVTAGGGPKFLIKEGITGFVAPDVAAFVEAIDRLVANRDLQAAMSRAARQYAVGISWDTVFEKVYTAYNHALYCGNAVPRPAASIITTDASGTRR